MGFTVNKGSQRVLRRGILKGVARLCLERFLGRYDLLGVRPRGGSLPAGGQGSKIYVLSSCSPPQLAAEELELIAMVPVQFWLTPRSGRKLVE